MIVVGYGHIGDGNLHIKVVLDGYESKETQDELTQLVDDFVMSYVRDAKGSVSAEHGVGLQKKPYLDYSKSPELISYMHKIKAVFDPNGIMNPYKVI